MNTSASLELEAQAPEQASAEQQTPERRPEHDQLSAFVGRWHAEGENKVGAPLGANTSVTGVETYEWLPGKFFLKYRWERRFADAEHIGLGVIGYDPSRGGLAAHFFDNLGYARTYEAWVGDRVLTLNGKWERATIAVRSDGNAMTIHWERSTDGTTWQPLCDLTATRTE